MEKENSEGKKMEQAGCLGIGMSFLVPIIGIIIYFSNKKNVSNPNTYLYAALAGVAFVVIVQIIGAASGTR